MPTAKPRLMFSADPDIAADIAKIAQLKGIPASRVVAEALLTMKPVFRDMVTALEAIELAGTKARQLAARYSGTFKRKIQPSLDDVERALMAAVHEFERIEGNRPAAKRSKRNTVDPRIKRAAYMVATGSE